VQDKGKRKIADIPEGEKSYKIKTGPLIENPSLVAEEKRK